MLTETPLDPMKILLVAGIAVFSLLVGLILRIREFTDQYPLKHEFFLKLHERFRNEGVRFPAAARSVKVEEK